MESSRTASVKPYIAIVEFRNVFLVCNVIAKLFY